MVKAIFCGGGVGELTYAIMQTPGPMPPLYREYYCIYSLITLQLTVCYDITLPGIIVVLCVQTVLIVVSDECKVQRSSQ